MQGGFRGNRYGTDKFQEIKEHAQRQIEEQRRKREVKDPVQPLIGKREGADEV